MSGPKVVRIVTREEIIALCEGHLARLHAAVEEWIKVGRRNKVLTDDEIAATRSRREALRNMLAQERFLDLQKAVPDEIAFLQGDQEARLARAASAKARVRAAQRRTEQAAAGVLAALGRRGVSVPAELRRALEDASAGRADGASAIRQAFALLSGGGETGVTDRQRRLADAHKETDDRQTFDQWLASQPTSVEDEGRARLHLRLAELAVVLGDEATAAFEERLRRVSSDEHSSRRSLLLDSLEIDLARAVSQAKERRALQTRLKMLAAELSHLGTESSAAASQSILARIDGPSEALAELEKEATAALGRHRDEAAAEARRRVILRGLAGLGYQVSEGLETAWVREGKVVIKRAAGPGYGVEISGRADAGRVQMRTVAFRNPDAPADAARDRDAETIFCGDVTKLQEHLAEAGGSVVIERALPVGAAPLRAVGQSSDDTVEHVRERAPDRVRRR
ncbi:MAG TPA: hypothetical protein VER08_10505 [Pyrinomonadaceae bacterium]|nr:hypothetical protein [Pyrinomonadaceae bacterium]